MANLVWGPFVTRATGSSLAIAFKLDGLATVTVNIGDQQFSKTIANDGSAFTDHVFCDGLSPATAYTYDLSIDGVLAAGPHTVMTLPAEGAPGSMDLFFINDLHPGTSSPDSFRTAYKAIRTAERPSVPRLAISGGDFESIENVYDLESRRQVVTDIRTKNWPERAQWWAETPIETGWDDHDSGGDNRAGSTLTAEWPVVLKVHDESFSGHTPYEDTLGRGDYRVIRIMDCVVIFADERTYRDPCRNTFPVPALESIPDKDTRVAFGSVQMAWLKAVLEQYKSAPFKFLVIGTTIVDNNEDVITGLGAARRDSIGIFYRTERNDLMDWIAADPERGRGLYVITGDDHVGRLYAVSTWRAGIEGTETDQYSGVRIASRTPQIIEIKCRALNAQNLHIWWDNHPDVYWAEPEPNVSNGERTIVRVKLETDASPPRALFEILLGGDLNDDINAPSNVRPGFSFHATHERAYLPIREGAEATFTPDDPAPLASYAYGEQFTGSFDLDPARNPGPEDYTPPAVATPSWTPQPPASTSYASPAIPASSWAPGADPSTGYATEAEPTTGYTPVSPPAAVNTVVNGDFETGDMTGWTSTGTVGVVAGTGVGGSYGCQIRGAWPAPFYPLGTIQQVIAVSPAGVTTLSYEMAALSPVSDFVVQYTEDMGDEALALWVLLRRIQPHELTYPGFTPFVDILEPRVSSVKLRFRAEGGQFSFYWIDSIVAIGSGTVWAINPGPATPWS